MAKHVATIRAHRDFHGMSIYTHYTISQKKPFYLAVKHKKNGDYNLILYEKTSSMKAKKSRP
jgi:hypothetical protein